MDQVQFYCGGFLMASALKTIYSPIERYRLIRQTQDILSLSSKDKMTNIVAYFQKSISNDGVKALFRGNLTAVYMWFPQMLAKTLFYQNIKQQVHDTDILSAGLSASLCGFVTMLFAYPFDTIRVRQATEFVVPQQAKIYTSFKETWFQVRQENGIFRGLYSGLSIGLLHTFLLAYSSIGLSRIDPEVPYNAELSFLAASILLYPLDSIRHRLQVKSLLFQQETAKRINIVEKLKFNFREAKLSWIYGGVLAHSCRTLLCVLQISMLSQQVELKLMN